MTDGQRWCDSTNPHTIVIAWFNLRVIAPQAQLYTVLAPVPPSVPLGLGAVEIAALQLTDPPGNLWGSGGMYPSGCFGGA